MWVLFQVGSIGRISIDLSFMIIFAGFVEVPYFFFVAT